MDSFFLEIIAKTEVAKHFKKGMMSGRIADILEVVVLSSGPNTTLAGCGPVIIPLVLSHEDRFKLDHSGIGKQQRRVVCGYE